MTHVRDSPSRTQQNEHAKHTHKPKEDARHTYKRHQRLVVEYQYSLVRGDSKCLSATARAQKTDRKSPSMQVSRFMSMRDGCPTSDAREGSTAPARRARNDASGEEKMSGEVRKLPRMPRSYRAYTSVGARRRIGNSMRDKSESAAPRPLFRRDRTHLSEWPELGFDR